jgi:hypothetical protein
MRLAYEPGQCLSIGFFLINRFEQITVFKEMAKKKEKNPHAVALGRSGGKARLQKLTSAQRKEIARKAAAARWSKQKGEQKPD